MQAPLGPCKTDADYKQECEAHTRLTGSYTFGESAESLKPQPMPS
jgi:hypothetical protein